MSEKANGHRTGEDEKNGVGGMMARFKTREIEDLKSPGLWRSCIAEFLGTGMLCMFSMGAFLYHETRGHPPALVHLSLEGGFYIGIIVTVLGAVSGGHVNPVISIGALVLGDITLVRFFVYGIFQISGGICFGYLLKVLTPPQMHGNFGLLKPGPDVLDIQACMVELIICFFLCFGTFAMLDKRRKDVQGSVPLMIGLIVCVNIFFSGHISGGCMNPVRSLVPSIMTGNMKSEWVYWVGGLIGGAAGTLLYDKVFSAGAMTGGLRYSLQCGDYEEVKAHDDHELQEIPDSGKDMDKALIL